MGDKSRRKGRNAEQLVVSDLRKRGVVVRSIPTPSVVRGGKRTFTESQGADLIGCDCTGKAWFVEVKAYKGRIPISEKGGLKLSQLANLLHLKSMGAQVYLAIVSPPCIYYVDPSMVVNRNRRSYSAEDAERDSAFRGNV